MRCLLDTCVLIWFFEGSRRIPDSVRDALTDPTSDLYMSDVSALELVIKHAMGRFPALRPPSRWLLPLARRHSIEVLPLVTDAIFRMESLPPLHKDPFDRLLVAQSLAHRLRLVTPDPLIRQYDVGVLWGKD